MQVTGCTGVICKNIEEEYLAYSPLTGETIVLSAFANFVLSTVLNKPVLYQNLLNALTQEQFDLGEDASVILQRTLSDLSKKGFVYY